MPAAPSNQGPINFGAINMQPQGQSFQPTPKTAVGQTPNLLQAPAGQPSGLLTPQARTQILTAVQKMTADGVSPDKIQAVVDYAKTKLAASPVQAPAYQPGTVPNPLQVAGAQMSIGNVIRQITGQFQQGATQAASSLGNLITGNQPAINPQNLKDAYAGGGLPAALAEGGAQSLKAGVQGVSQLGAAVGGISTALTAPLAPLFNAGTKIGQNLGNMTPTPIAKGVAAVGNNPIFQDNAPDIMNLANLAFTEQAPKLADQVSPTMTKIGEAASSVSDAAQSAVGGAKEAIVGDASANIMNRVARLNPTDFSKFEKMAGETPGEYLARTGNFGSPDTIIANEATKFTNSLNEVDTALESLPGTYKPGAVKDALAQLQDKAEAVSTENVKAPFAEDVQALTDKFNSSGLDMAEINTVKRLYERNVKLGYSKLLNPDAVEKATNVDSAIRDWQANKAEDLGFTNISDLNKQTQISKFIINKLGDKIVGQSGLNGISLTDWIMLSGGTPESVAGFLVKKFFSSKTVQANIAKLLSTGKPDLPIKANLSPKTPALPQPLKTPVGTSPTSIAPESGKPMSMGTYKLAPNPYTGRAEIKNYRKPGVNFYNKKKK